jgi:hypothetical protein
MSAATVLAFSSFLALWLILAALVNELSTGTDRIASTAIATSTSTSEKPALFSFPKGLLPPDLFILLICHSPFLLYIAHYQN